MCKTRQLLHLDLIDVLLRTIEKGSRPRRLRTVDHVRGPVIPARLIHPIECTLVRATDVNELRKNNIVVFISPLHVGIFFADLS